VKWSFALLLVGAAALDAFWVMPAQRDAQARARAVEPYLRKCRGSAAVPAPPPGPTIGDDGDGELKVIDVQLLTPRQAAR
jgi:hypothetical protein